MSVIEILGTDRFDERDSAFPMAVQLPDGDILCSFSVGGGPSARGGTDWARSRDGGETWQLEGTLLPPRMIPIPPMHSSSPCLQMGRLSMLMAAGPIAGRTRGLARAGTRRSSVAQRMGATRGPSHR